jgi:hypothetical protein
MTEKEMREAIARVRELHKETKGYCDICYDYYDYEAYSVQYPCPTIKALDGEMTTRERLNRLTYDAARDGFYDEVVSVEDILKTLDNKRNCEHEWITYGTRGQECKKCGFMHDYS